MVDIELQDWIDERNNEQIFSQVRDRLSATDDELPQGAGKPEFDDMRGAVAYSMTYALTWRDGSDKDFGILNRLAARLGDRLRNLPGTEQVVFFGIAEEEIQVDVNAAEASALGLAPDRLAAQVATLVLSFRSFTLAALIGLVAVLSVGLGMLSLWAGAFHSDSIPSSAAPA